MFGCQRGRRKRNSNARKTNGQYRDRKGGSKGSRTGRRVWVVLGELHGCLEVAPIVERIWVQDDEPDRPLENVFLVELDMQQWRVRLFFPLCLKPYLDSTNVKMHPRRRKEK